MRLEEESLRVKRGFTRLHSQLWFRTCVDVFVLCFALLSDCLKSHASLRGHLNQRIFDMSSLGKRPAAAVPPAALRCRAHSLCVRWSAARPAPAGGLGTLHTCCPALPWPLPSLPLGSLGPELVKTSPVVLKCIKVRDHSLRKERG